MCVKKGHANRCVEKGQKICLEKGHENMCVEKGQKMCLEKGDENKKRSRKYMCRKGE